MLSFSLLLSRAEASHITHKESCSSDFVIKKQKQHTLKTASQRIDAMRIYTKIHNKTYNLSGFSHPGGMVALSLASSRDATELFESHHQFSDKSKINSILQKYEIPESECPESIANNNVYDWEKTLNSDFTKELKAMAIQILGTDIKANSYRWRQYLLLALILLSQFILFAKGFWFAVLTYPLAIWVFSVNVFHDAGHFAISQKYWRLNCLGTNAGFMLATPYHWYHQHTIGHHSFPNIMGRDPDLYHAPDALRHSEDIPVTSVHCIQHFVFIFIEALGIPGNYLM
jgi:cytochrome b involved in lipid metabolism